MIAVMSIILTISFIDINITAVFSVPPLILKFYKTATFFTAQLCGLDNFCALANHQVSL